MYSRVAAKIARNPEDDWALRINLSAIAVAADQHNAAKASCCGSWILKRLWGRLLLGILADLPDQGGTV
jgi:hypothetical protein